MRPRPSYDDKLVDHIQARRVFGDGQRRANAKAIDRRAVGDEACDLRLVEIAAGDDPHARQPGRIELPPGPPRLHGQIARVQPYGGRCGGHTGLHVQARLRELYQPQMS